MRRRRLRTRRPRFRFVRLLTGVALVATLVLAIFNYQAPPELGVETASTPLPRSPSSMDESPHSPPAAPESRPGSTAPSQARSRSPAIRPVIDRANQAPAAGTAQRSDTDESADGAANMARLETARATQPSIAPKVKQDFSPDRVARAQFTTDIEEQEPINRIDTVFSMDGEVYSADGRPLNALYYFTELNGMRGETVLHRWEHNGETVAQISFEVSGDPWSVYSRQDLPPALGGEWRVVVTDAQGNILRTDNFSYQNF